MSLMKVAPGRHDLIVAQLRRTCHLVCRWSTSQFDEQPIRQVAHGERLLFHGPYPEVGGADARSNARW